MTRPIGDIVYVFKKNRSRHHVVYQNGNSEYVSASELAAKMAEAGITCVNVALPPVAQIGRKKFSNLAAAMGAVRDGDVIYVNSPKCYASV
jgi:hypothetical protein